MKPTDPLRHARPGRRGFLLAGAAGGAALLSGCGLNNPFSSTPASEAVRELAPDVGSAVRAVLALRGQLALLAATGDRYPGLRPRLDAAVTAHRAHVDRLVDAVPDHVDTSATDAPAQVVGGRPAALRTALRGELRLQRTIDDLAVRAESGAFARLLGSVAASSAQLAGATTVLPVVAEVAPSGPALDAMQQTLAAEHAAVFLDGVLGAQASKSRQPALYAALTAAYRAHRANRDDLVARISAAGRTPVAAAVGYELPSAMGTVRELDDAALHVERRIAQSYGQLVENTAGAERRRALVALNDAAARQLEFRGTPEMFPGSAL
jgi:hypothetical protein